MARFLNNKTLKDKIPTSELLNNVNMLSVNQINAKVKVQEVWKALNIEGYPLKIDCQKASDTSTSTRAMTSGRLIESGKSTLVSNACVSDAICIWNQAPDSVKNYVTLPQLKNAAKLYVRSLPT